MNEPFDAIEVTDNVYWVGAVDWTIRDFHGYATERGTSYNAFLVMADKVALIDTVKAPFHEEMMSRIASLVNPEEIAYVISNHAEMDHSGCLPRAIEQIKPEKVFASEKGAKALEAHFHWDRDITVVKDGEQLSLGNTTLSFIETPMLHWPDSMFTFFEEEGVLFSQDAFGMHLASSQRFADEVDDGVLEYEGARYFANILLPFAALVPPVLEKASTLDISIIAPDHGPIWRKHLGRITNLYATWAAQQPACKAVIVYDTMWGSTESMAKAIEDGLVAEGAQVRSMRAREHHRSNIATEMLDAGALIVGSPTLNNNMFPAVADVLTYLKGLKPKNRIGTMFGSYGWSDVVVKQLGDFLSAMKVQLVGEGISSRYVPDKDTLAQCRALGRQVAQTLKERVK